MIDERTTMTASATPGRAGRGWVRWLALLVGLATVGALMAHRQLSSKPAAAPADSKDGAKKGGAKTDGATKGGGEKPPLAVATLVVFVAFGVHVLAGGAFELRTVIAMTLRSGFWVTQALLLPRVLDRRMP